MQYSIVKTSEADKKLLKLGYFLESVSDMKDVRGVSYGILHYMKYTETDASSIEFNLKTQEIKGWVYIFDEKGSCSEPLDGELTSEELEAVNFKKIELGWEV